ncbi:MAG: DNA-formamidopyrimidine glycosylase [bacterium]
MPELPEVQTIADGLNKKTKNAIITDVFCDWKKMIQKPKSWQEFRKRIVGEKIQNVERKGKFVVFVLSNSYLVVHLRMTGHFIIIDEKKKKDKNDPMHEKVNQYIHFVLKLKDGRVAALSDLRKFGKISLIKKDEFQKDIAMNKIGTDPMAPEFTFQKFLEILKNKKGNIKQILLDQSLIAGIGNIYSSEILWEAKINPLRKVDSLNKKELEQIFKAIKKVLQIAVENRGDSESDYRDIDGKQGNYQNIQKVYQKDSEKCPRKDGGIIKRVKIGQRSGFYCPVCQK